MIEVEKYLPEEPREKLDGAVKSFKRFMIENGGDPNCLSTIEIIAVQTIRDARLPYLELVEKLGEKLELTFLGFVMFAALSQSNIPAHLFLDAIYSSREKGFSGIDLETGILESQLD